MDTFLTADLTAAVQAKRAKSATQKQVADASAGRVETVQSEEESEEIFVWRRNVPNELVPVVTLSSDLAGTLVENNPPDPAEFVRQSNALVRCVAARVEVGSLAQLTVPGDVASSGAPPHGR